MQEEAPADRADPPRVVIAHDFAETFGGAERIVATAAEAFPEAPFWAILGRREVARRMGVAERFSTVLPGWGPLLRHYRSLTPVFPAVVRARRLPEADVLLTSSYAFAHGFATENGAPQVCYCYSPFRFAWSMTESYAEELGGGPLGARALNSLAALMRTIDRRAAQRVTRYLAESKFVADQIERFYGMRAEIVRPPVDCDLFRPPSKPGHDGYFLLCGRLIEPYKRPSVVVEAFRSLAARLLVVGDGPALPRLRQQASSNVEFLGHLDEERLVPVMQRCAAAIFPSREDFGLTAVEVMACGRPVLAYGAGGALETVLPGRTGEFFHEQAAEAVIEAVRRFDPLAYDPAAVRAHAERFRRDRFRDAILAAVRETARAGSASTV